MSERWTNTANDKGELSEMLIQSLIETASIFLYTLFTF